MFLLAASVVALPTTLAGAEAAPLSKVERVLLVVELFDTPQAAVAARSVAGLDVPMDRAPGEDLDLSASVWNATTGELDLNADALDVSYDYFDPAAPDMPPASFDGLLPDTRRFLLGGELLDPLRCPLPRASFSDTWGAPRFNNRVHVGTDMIAPFATPVLAMGDATIVRVDRVDEYRPNVDIDPGGLSVSYITVYGDLVYNAHLSSIPLSIQPGVKILAGSTIGLLGQSGNASISIPHLHLQYHPLAGPPQNPYPLLRTLC